MVSHYGKKINLSKKHKKKHKRGPLSGKNAALSKNLLVYLLGMFSIFAFMPSEAAKSFRCSLENMTDSLLKHGLLARI
ncbi:MAG: hypothetical protein ACPGWR_07480 [Ardenticatenaceae bacterium]